MAQELDNKIRNLRAELTRLVRDGLDEDGFVLRRMLAELERLENQRLTLRGAHLAESNPRQRNWGHSHVSTII